MGHGKPENAIGIHKKGNGITDMLEIDVFKLNGELRSFS
jgi:hypothetical protein